MDNFKMIGKSSSNLITTDTSSFMGGGMAMDLTSNSSIQEGGANTNLIIGIAVIILIFIGVHILRRFCNNKANDNELVSQINQESEQQLPEDAPEDVSEDVPEDVSEDVPEGVPEGVQEGLQESVPESVPEGVPESVPEGVQEGLQESVPEGVQEDEQNDLRAEIQNEIRNEIEKQQLRENEPCSVYPLLVNSTNSVEPVEHDAKAVTQNELNGFSNTDNFAPF